MKAGPLDEWEVARLADYNGDRSRGVVFTSSAQQDMADLQRRFHRYGWSKEPEPVPNWCRSAFLRRLLIANAVLDVPISVLHWLHR